MARILIDNSFTESRSPAVREVKRIVAEIAPTDIRVMILGESGTGKEVTAVHIHSLSGHKHQPFIKVTCPTLAPAGLDDLLRKNGTSGSAETVWEAGTIFLDDISELDPACQSKLLHALPDNDAVPNERGWHARVISSSRRHLEEDVSAGRFRGELLYRLNDVCLRLPPLRERKEDIPELIEFFLTKYSAQFGRRRPALSTHSLETMKSYPWPGNIRQLENAVKRIIALGDERAALAELRSSAPEAAQQSGAEGRVSLKQAARAASQRAERSLILKTLEQTRWNRKRAARELQISYKALLYKLKQIGVDELAGS